MQHFQLNGQIKGIFVILLINRISLSIKFKFTSDREKGGDWFYHEKKEKKFIFLNENYIGKIREVKLKWLSIQEFLKASTWYWCASCDYDLFVSSVDIKIMNDPSLFSSNTE